MIALQRLAPLQRLGVLRRRAPLQRLAALRRLAVSALLGCVLGPSTVLAHTLSESISSWQVSGRNIRLQFLVPDLEAKRLSSDSAVTPSADVVGAYLKAHVSASATGRRCNLTYGPRVLAATVGYSRFEFDFVCPADNHFKIQSSAFYELVPSHTNFARIQDSEGTFTEELLTDARREAAVAGADSAAADGGALRSAGFTGYVELGMKHIFTGLDHLSFMLGLVLISRRLRDLILVVTGFTIGHSVTLALAVTGVLRPDAQYIDALVALTIVLIGAENIGDSTHHPLPLALGLGGLLMAMAVAKSLGAGITLPMTLLIGGGIFSACYLLWTGKMRDAGRVRLLVTLVFGLIHGFGFAANLLAMRLPTAHLAQLLIGFNVGVEVGQLTVVAAALWIAKLFIRLRVFIPRPLVTDLAASFLVGEGLFWFVGRTVAMG